MTRPKQWVEKSGLILSAIVAIGALLRLGLLDAQSLWYDETSSLQFAGLGWDHIFGQRWGWVANQTPLFYALIRLASFPADPTVTGFFVRLPSALAGIVTLPLTYLIGKEMFGKVQGLLGALLLALSTVHLDYSQDLRPYSLLTCFFACAFYCLLRIDRASEGSPVWKWWLGFGAAMCATMAATYVGLTLAAPAIAPYAAYVLWKRTLGRRGKPARAGSEWAAIGVAVVGMALVALADLLDVFGTTHTGMDLSKFRPAWVVTFPVALLRWFGRFGLGAEGQRILGNVLVLAFIATVLALVARRGEGRRWGLVCASIVWIPAVLLAVLSTSNSVFERYVLFALPFVMLVAAHGAWSAGSLLRCFKLERLARPTGAALSALLAVLFAVGAANYVVGALGAGPSLAFRSDYRAASAYLARSVTSRDLIVFLDEPALGVSACDYYWHDTPPAPVYDARDPRVFSAQAENIYWVISWATPEIVAGIANNLEPGMSAQRFAGLDVIRQTGGSVWDGMNALVTRMESVASGFQAVVTLRGSLEQGQGDLDAAAANYRRAGPYFTVGAEHLRTADGFMSVGLASEGWQNAFQSKFVEPQRPEVHRWLAEHLRAGGWEKEAAQEDALAAMLAQEAGAGAR